MKILLDECVPRKLAKEFEDHTVETVRSMGWRGIKNGALLQKVTQAKFEAFITVDKNLQYQQKIVDLPFAVILLDSPLTTLVELQKTIPECLNILPEVQPGKIYTCLSSR